MRIGATIPDSDGKQLTRLAKELGLSRSELVSEAVSYWSSKAPASGRWK